MEVIQAYPVAGMQLSIGALGLVPIGALLIDDSVRNRQPHDIRWRWFAPAVVAVCLALVGLNAYFAAADFNAGVPAGLPGMNSTRLPAAQAETLRSTTGALEADCSAFITYPGLPSFYAWTGETPPVPLESGPWMFVLDDASQQTMVEQLRAVPRLCVVEDQAMIDFWAHGKPVPDRALVRFIESDFVVASKSGDYRVLVARQ